MSNESLPPYKKANVYEQSVVASNYELLRSVPETVFEQYANRIIDRIPNGGNVVDAGFGPGHILLNIAEAGKGKNIKVVGIDSSIEMHKLVQEKIHGLSLNDLELSTADMTEYFLSKPNSFDAIHFKAILHCIGDQEDLLDSMDNALHSRGLIITGHESSQTESRIERLYDTSPNIDDPELETVFDHYFKLRLELAEKTGLSEKDFSLRKFPAGDSKKACEYFINKGYTIVSTSGDDEMNFDRKYTMGELINCIRNGTFGVFRDGLTLDDMDYLSKQMDLYIEETKIDLYKIRSIPARMQQYILQKP